MKKKMSDRDKMLLYYLGACLMVAAVYFLVFMKFNERRDELITANDQLQQEVAQLETMKAQEAAVLDETDQMRTKVMEVLQKFPPEVRIQNAIYDLNKMYEGIPDVEIQSESYVMNQVFFQPANGLDENGNPIAQNNAQAASTAAITAETPIRDVVTAASNYIGYRSDIQVVFTTTYASLKEIVNYINNLKDRVTITDIAVTSISGGDDLSCSMTMSMYSIAGTGREYEQPDVKDNYGKKGNILSSN